MRDGRAWLHHSGAVDGALVGAWLAESDRRRHEARAALDRELRRSYEFAPGISVIVPATPGGTGLATCLRSLAGQSLAGDLFEVIVVLTGHSAEAGGAVDRLRQNHPALDLRVIRLNRGGRSRALDAGIAAAGRTYTTMVDGGDRVSPSYLEVLLARARPGAVPVAAIDGRPTGDIGEATSFDGAKAVSTDLIKAVPHDALFWLTVVVRGRLVLERCPPGDGAVYHPAAEPAPAAFTVEGAVQTIALLDRLVDRADARTSGLVRRRISEQTGHVNGYLRQRPADHPAIVAALDRHPIEHLPYAEMNAGLPRGLAVAYAFPPYADTSAVVTAKRIRARGEVVDVIYNAMDRIRETDESIRRISGPFVGDEAALPTPSYFSDWGSMERFSVEGLEVIREWEATKGPYRRLYSRAHFAASHFLAAAYKLVNPAVTWTAEFSDPLSRDVGNRERGTPVREGAFLTRLRTGLRALGLPPPGSPNCFVWCEELAYALADELVFTNENQLEHMLGYCANRELAAAARGKAVVVPHPTLPPPFYAMADHDYPLDAGAVHLAYFGNFYATRGLDDVLRAVAGGDPWTRARVRVHVFTTKPAELERRAVELGISDCVRVSPYVRYLEFLNLTTRFDCLIVNDAITGDSHGHNPYLPSKWSDYRGGGAPVWGLVEAGSPLSRQALDFSSPVGDVQAAGDVLSLIVHKKLSGPVLAGA